MKKLLAILGGLTVTVSPTTYMISCGNKNKETNNSNGDEGATDSTQNTLKLIEQFKKEVNDIISKQFNDSIKNMFELEGDQSSKNSFLKNDILKDVQKGETEKPTLTNEQKISLTKDLESKINIENIKSELNRLKTNSEYDILLKDLDNVYKETSIDWDTLRIKYNTDSITISNVIFNFSIVTNYKSIDLSTETYDTKLKFVYSQSNNNKIIEWGQSAYDEIKNTYLFNSEKSVINSDSMEKDDKNKIFSDNSDKYAKYINDVNKGIAADVIGKLKPIEDNQAVKVEFSANQDIFKSIKWDASLKMKEQEDGVWIPDDSEIFNYLFKNESNKVEQKLNDSSVEVQKSIYERVNKNYKSIIASYKKDVENVLKAANKSNELENKKITSSSKLGYMTLKGLTLKISNYTHELPDLDLLTAFSVDGNENLFDSEKLNMDSSKNLAAIYYNVMQGVESFHKVYGIQKPTDSNTLSAFTGKTEGMNVSLWDKFQEINNGRDMNYYSRHGNWISDYINLSSSALAEYRTLLLKNGEQKDFKFSIQDPGYNKSERGIFALNDKGIVIKEFTNGLRYSPVKLEFELDFVKIKFSIGILFNRPATVFEKK